MCTGPYHVRKTSTQCCGERHLIPDHVITRGHCWAGIAGDQPLRLDMGDVIVFPQGDAHVLSSTAGMRAVPNASIYRQAREGPLPCAMTAGRGDESAHLVCGFLGCDARPFNPLLASLPRVLRVSDRAGGAIEVFVRMAVACRRCSTSQAGGCSLRRMNWSAAPTRLRRLRIAWVTSRRRRSVAPSRRWSGWRPASGAAGAGVRQARPQTGQRARPATTTSSSFSSS